MRTVLLAVVFGSAVAIAGPASADPIPILPVGATWNYTFTDPTSDPTWNTTTGVGGIWASGPAPFGNCSPAACAGFTRDFDANTTWPADNTGGFNDDLWVRTAVTLPAVQLQSLHWNLGADNGFKLYVNGFLLASENAEEYTFRWEYSGTVPHQILGPGPQVIAVALDDHGGLTAFDMEIVGTATPEPASLMLCAIGFLGAGMRKLWA
jgi:hypothetical protein